MLLYYGNISTIKNTNIFSGFAETLTQNRNLGNFPAWSQRPNAYRKQLETGPVPGNKAALTDD